MTAFDVAAAIAEFIAEPSQTTLELPRMTTGQRKATKKLVEEHAELRCESYGFGSERQLHLFKETAATVPKGLNLTAPPVSIKNTFIDDCVALDSDSGASPQCSTRASSAGSPRSLEVGSSSDTASPASAKRELVFNIRPEDLGVQNTFIHIKDSFDDGRAVQSMPHGMFRQCILSEASMAASCDRVAARAEPTAHAATSPLQHEAKGAQEMPLIPGTLVVIGGLVKAPAFNGLSGIVQDWDEEIGRYNVLIVFSTPGSACQQAKLKRENLQLLTPYQ